MIVSIIIILFLLQSLILLSYKSFNELSLRSLIVPETDDVEESARNAKEVNKILSFQRIILVVLIILNTSLLNIAFNNFFEINEFATIVLSSLCTFYLLVINTFLNLIPNSVLSKLIILSILLKSIATKLIYQMEIQAFLIQGMIILMNLKFLRQQVYLLITKKWK